MKLIGTALTLSVLALLAVWYVPAMMWGYKISREVARIEAGETQDHTSIAELSEGPPLVAWLRRNKRLNEAFNPTELTRERYVSYKFEMPFESLLKSGENAPDPAFKELYALARVPQTVMSRCPEILQHLGSKCDVAQTSATISRDGTARLSGQLHYVPSYEMGDPSTVSNGKLISARTRLIKQRELRNTPENRAVVFGRALDVCAKLRALIGNCVISSINMDVSSQGRIETLSATAHFDVYADSSQYRRDSLKSELDQIAYELLN